MHTRNVDVKGVGEGGRARAVRAGVRAAQRADRDGLRHAGCHAAANRHSHLQTKRSNHARPSATTVVLTAHGEHRAGWTRRTREALTGPSTTARTEVDPLRITGLLPPTTVSVLPPGSVSLRSASTHVNIPAVKANRSNEDSRHSGGRERGAAQSDGHGAGERRRRVGHLQRRARQRNRHRGCRHGTDTSKSAIDVNSS